MIGITAGYVWLRIGQSEMCVSLLHIHLLWNRLQSEILEVATFSGKEITAVY